MAGFYYCADQERSEAEKQELKYGVAPAAGDNDGLMQLMDVSCTHYEVLQAQAREPDSWALAGTMVAPVALSCGKDHLINIEKSQTPPMWPASRLSSASSTMSIPRRCAEQALKERLLQVEVHDPRMVVPLRNPRNEADPFRDNIP